MGQVRSTCLVHLRSESECDMLPDAHQPKTRYARAKLLRPEYGKLLIRVHTPPPLFFFFNQMLTFVFCLLFGKGSDIQICFHLKLSLNNHLLNFRNTPLFAFANRFLLLSLWITLLITLINTFWPSETFVCTCTCTFALGTFGNLLEC